MVCVEVTYVHHTAQYLLRMSCFNHYFGSLKNDTVTVKGFYGSEIIPVFFCYKITIENLLTHKLKWLFCTNKPVLNAGIQDF